MQQALGERRRRYLAEYAQLQRAVWSSADACSPARDSAACTAGTEHSSTAATDSCSEGARERELLSVLLGQGEGGQGEGGQGEGQGGNAYVSAVRQALLGIRAQAGHS